MTLQELSDLVCADLPGLSHRDRETPPERMLAQWAWELTAKYKVPIVVTLVPSTTQPGAVAVVAYPLPVNGTLPNSNDGGERR